MLKIIITSIILLGGDALSFAHSNVSPLDSLIDMNSHKDSISFNKVELLRKKGVRFKNEGKLEEARYILTFAAEQFLELDSLKSYSRSLNNIGTVHWHLGNYDKAFKFLFKSEKINDSIFHNPGLFLNYINLGNFKLKQHKFTESLVFYNRALDIAKMLNDISKLSLIYGSISLIYSSVDSLNSHVDLIKSEEYRDKSLGYDSSITISKFINSGYLKENNLEYDEALDYYFMGLDYDKLNKSSLVKIDLLNNVGNVYFIKNQVDQAIIYFDKALTMALSLGAKEQVKYLNKNLSKCWTKKGEYEIALDFYNMYDIYKDSIYDKTKSRQIAELETVYETEKKEQQIILQKIENDRLMYILLLSVGFTIIIIYIYTQRQRAVKKLRKREGELHTQEVGQLIQHQELKSINAMLEGEEKERKRIAEDLHDRVGSMLSAMKLQSDPSDEKMVGLLDETADEVRRISHNLETQVLNRFGLAAALEDLAEKIKNSGKVEFELHHLDLDERLDNKIEINTYRIVQELISNSLKHSQATVITTQVNCVADQLIVMVEDNGIGFDSLVVKELGGMGLNNVASRTFELNGNFNVDSNKGQGTAITVEIPL